MSVMSYNGAAIIGTFVFYAHVLKRESERSSFDTRDLIWFIFSPNFSFDDVSFDAPLGLFSVPMRRSLYADV